MIEFRSQYEMLREKLEKEGRIKRISPDRLMEMVDAMNAEAEADEADLNLKTIESARELADIVLNA